MTLLARLERFELPTFWFVGAFWQAWVFINQPLAALASRICSLSMARLRHTQFECGTCVVEFSCGV